MGSHRLLAGVKLVETFYSVTGSNVFNSEIPLPRIFSIIRFIKIEMLRYVSKTVFIMWESWK